MARSSLYRGWFWDKTNSRLEAYYDNTKGFHIDGCGNAAFSGSVTAATGVTVTACGLTVTAGGLTVTAGVTTASGGLVVTGSTTLGACAVAYTWPAADGSCGTQLTTDGCGALSWAAASLGALKEDLGVLCIHEALELVGSTPIHRFRYDKNKIPRGYWAPDYELVGVFGEEAPWAMQGKNKENFSPMQSAAYNTAAISALKKRVEALESK